MFLLFKLSLSASFFLIQISSLIFSSILNHQFECASRRPGGDIGTPPISCLCSSIPCLISICQRLNVVTLFLITSRVCPDPDSIIHRVCSASCSAAMTRADGNEIVENEGRRSSGCRLSAMWFGQS